MKNLFVSTRLTLFALCLFAALSPASLLGQTAGGATKTLYDPAAADALQQLSLNDNCEGDVSYKIEKDSVLVTVVPNSKSSFPGVKITPAKPWDASGFGHVEINVTNEGSKSFRVNLAVYNGGSGQQHSNVNILTLKPGQTTVLSTIFNYSYGGGSYELDTSALDHALIFIGKSDVEQKLRFTALVAGGHKGEKPVVPVTPVRPENAAVMPKDGFLFGGPVTIDPAKQLVAVGGKATLAKDGKSLQVELKGDSQTVALKPVIGRWNLNRFIEVHIKVKNTGTTPLNPGAFVSSPHGHSDVAHPAAPIAPGASGEIVIPFTALVPERLIQDPAQVDPMVKKTWEGGQPGTGTSYKSNITTDVTLTSAKDGSAQSFAVTSITAELPIFNRPEWLGKKPPVEGDWVQTLSEEFNGNKINDHLWNIYSDGEWHIGSATHYSKDNVIVKDGKLDLRVEAKRGHHNDNPDYLVNDYQSGYADTFGKWTQRYGYFEARMKLPTAPNMFLAWWLMPDWGQASGRSIHMRTETKEGGMEFDIMETLSIWGPYRHDFGMHWDSYMKYHKANGDFQYYVQPDKDGFITVGMLWLPGLVVLYDNGVEVSRWESPRVGSVQEYMILDLATGGWEAEPMDDKQLPADFVLDYIRVWQRKDLATPGDGAKPNDGGPLFPFTEAEQKERAKKQ